MDTATNTRPVGRAARFAAWDRALRRAIENNLVALDLGQGRYAISSSRDEDRGYLVSTSGDCECEAARNGHRQCQHVALALALAGIIPWPNYTGEVEPDRTMTCPRCHGRGSVDTSGGFHGLPAHQRTGRCGLCDGQGAVILPAAPIVPAA